MSFVQILGTSVDTEVLTNIEPSTLIESLDHYDEITCDLVLNISNAV